LAQIGVTPFAVRAPDINEGIHRGELPRDYVNRIAAEKVAAVDAGHNEVVLCADTTVALGRRIMGKPADAAEAAAFLFDLSGRRHRVITSVAVKRGAQVWQKDVQSTVAMKTLSNIEVKAYLASDDWRGKAGGYAIQGPAGAFIPWINGSYTGIVGLPLTEAAGLLTAAGYPIYGVI
jgi:septum formation protein